MNCGLATVADACEFGGGEVAGIEKEAVLLVSMIMELVGAGWAAALFATRTD